MPEMTPGPELDWLTRLQPNGSVLDPADVLFHAGRASARTPRAWKLAFAGLMLANAVTVGLLLSGRDAPPLPDAASAPVVVPTPAPALPTGSRPGSDPDSVYSLARSFDPDAPPPPAGFVAPDRPAAPTTVGSLAVTD
jgi:hypothetical protein